MCFRHAFGRSKNYRDKSGLLTEEEVDVLGEKVHFSLLLVKEQCTRAFYIIISVANFSNDEIEKHDRHGKYINEPESPHDPSCYCCKKRVICFLNRPRIKLYGYNISNRVSEHLDEATKGLIH